MKISLETRICDLKVSIKGTYVEQCLTQLKNELKSRFIKVNPSVWISTDWFCPDGYTGFAVPFFLLSEELIALEKEMMGQAEGEGHDWCMMLMRHEMGHVLDNAYGLRKKKIRQQLFGLSSVPYPEKYRPDTLSRNYVRNLEDFYAQAHPDEDWAETFAVWLNPTLQWRKAYGDWPALTKLEYVNSMMEEIAFQKPLKKTTSKVDFYRDDTLTLEEFYSERKARQNKSHRQQSDSTRPLVLM